MRLCLCFSVALVCLPAVLMAPPLVRDGHAELLTRDGLSQRSDYLKRVEALVEALTAADRSADPTAASEFRSLVVTLDAALRDLRVREAGARSGKVRPPTAFSQSSTGAGEAGPRPLAEIPDDWLLKSLSEARRAVERLAQDLDRGEPLSSARIGQNLAEIADRVSKISRPE